MAKFLIMILQKGILIQWQIWTMCNCAYQSYLTFVTICNLLSFIIPLPVAKWGLCRSTIYSKLGLCRSTIFSKLVQLVQISPNLSKLITCRGIKRKLVAGEIVIWKFGPQIIIWRWMIWKKIKNLTRLRLAKFLIFFPNHPPPDHNLGQNFQITISPATNFH